VFSMNYRLGLLIGLFSTYTSIANAQTQWQGRVINATNQQPLSAAIITLSRVSAGDTLPVAFTQADVNGAFRLTRAGIDPTTHCLQARAFGYAPQTRMLGTLPATEAITFTLPERPLQLNEVRVRAAVPAYENKDTTTYVARHFKDGTERNVEDLLRKLPGVRVGEDGRITVQGKPVDKVMIEGEDVFSKNYRLVTRSLTAAAVDQVEVVDNYTESPLLRNIERSGKTVINLKVGEKAKLRVFGNAEAAPGTQGRYSAGLTLFSLKGRTKTGLVVNSNNLGNDPAGAFSYSLFTEPSVQEGLGLPAARFRRNSLPTLPDVETDRYLYRRLTVPGLSLSRKWGSRVRSSAYIYGSEGQARQQLLSDYQYTLENGSFRSRDSSAYAQSVRQWVGRAQVDAALGARTSLRLIANGLLDQTRQNDLTRSEATTRIDTARTTEALTHRRSSYSAQLIRRLNDRQALQLDALTEYDSYARSLSALSSRYATLLPTLANGAGTLRGIEQPITGWQRNILVAGKWLVRPDSSRLGLALGEQFSHLAFTYCRQTEHLSGTFRSNPNQRIADSTSAQFSPDASYGLSVLRLEGQWSGRWRAFTVLALGAAEYTYADWQNQYKATQGQFWLLPMLRLNWKITSLQTIGLQFRQSRDLPTLADLTTGYVFNSYRSASRGAGIWFPSESQSATLSYSLKDWVRWFTIFGAVTYARRSNLYSLATEANPLFGLSTYQPYEGNVDMLMGNLQFETLVSVIDAKIKLNLNYIQSEQVAALNNSALQQNQTQQLRADVYLIATWMKAFIIPELRWSHTLGQARQGSFMQSQRIIQPTFSLKTRTVKGFLARASAEYMNWQAGSNRAEGFFVDAQISYNPPNSKWGFAAKARNLLNAPTLAFTSFAPYLTTQQMYILQPGFLTVSVQRQL
jgi:hypothetical protein